MAAIATDPPSSARPAAPAETPPLPLGYAPAVFPPQAGYYPARRIWPAVAALATGLALLGLGLFALLHLLAALMSPQGTAFSRDARDILMAVVIIFAAVCTMAGLLFLAIGLRWLGAAARGG